MRHLKLNQIFILVAAMLVLAGCSGGGSSSQRSTSTASSDQNVFGDDDKIISQPQPDPTAPEPQPAPGSEPTVKLTVDNDVVDAGGSVTLAWESSNVDTCAASGSWTGDKPTTGQQVFNGISANQTFSLNCTGAGGSAVSMVSVAVLGSLQISWQAPTENIDGTPVDALSAFRIHYGVQSGQYDSVVEVQGGASSHSIDVIRGEYFIAMTAVDVEGDESGLSNEVVKNAI